MEKYQSRNPNNAGITIEYGKDNPVKFKYVKETGTFRIVFMTFLGLWTKLNLILALILVLRSGFTDYYFPGIPLVPFITYWLLPPFLATLMCIDNDKLMSYMPSINMFSARFPLGCCKYKKIEKMSKKVVEIPIFDNLFLDYNAVKDYSRYLKKVEIIEHQFLFENYILYFWKWRKKQDTYWKARFTFDKVPKEGFLEVWFK